MPTLEEYHAEHPETAPKRKVRHPEWALQTKLKTFLREFCLTDHEFAAHDRSYDKSGTQHIYEAQRGIRRAWMDTELAIEGGMTFRCELKWGTAKPTDEQNALIARMNSLGHPTIWTNSIVEYAEKARSAGVKFHAGARARAMYLDEWLRATFAEPPKTKKPAAYRAPRVRATKAGLRVAAFAQRPR